MKEFERYSEIVKKHEEKKVVSITVKLVMDDCTGELWITDMMFQEGDAVTGYTTNTKGLLEKSTNEDAVEGKRFYNGVIRGSNMIIVPNWGSTSTGMDVKLYPKDVMKADSIVIATGAGAHQAVISEKVNADDEIALLASSRECLHNGSSAKKKGFFQYCAACDSKHTITVEKGKSARVYVEFQEMQDGSELV